MKEICRRQIVISDLAKEYAHVACERLKGHRGQHRKMLQCWISVQGDTQSHRVKLTWTEKRSDVKFPKVKV